MRDNFSYCVFKTREALREYFEIARDCLVRDGLFFLDLFGGTETIIEDETDTELDDFVSLCSGLYNRVFLMWQKDSGIEIMDDGPEPEAGPAVCQVCGAELKPDITVFCRRCRTPHHDDCWKYNEGCSTFACGETKFQKKY